MKCFWCLVTKLDRTQCENQKSSVPDNDLRHLIEKEKRKITRSAADETKSFEKPKNKANNFLNDFNPGNYPNCNVYKVTISNDMVGAIIGHGGSKISEIRSNSKARINIDERVQGLNFLWNCLAHLTQVETERSKSSWERHDCYIIFIFFRILNFQKNYIFFHSKWSFLTCGHFESKKINIFFLCLTQTSQFESSELASFIEKCVQRL